MTSKHKVRVAVRVRPQLQKEDNVWVNVVSENQLQTLNHRNTNETLQYVFERVFGPETSQLCVYENCGRQLLKHTLEGKNASVFAYGPTGAGKTHTVLGSAEDPGLIPRCVKDIFSLIQTERTQDPNHWLYDVTYSYLEIYQEKVQDLLNPSKVDLPIREDQHKNILVSGLTEQAIDSVQDFNHTFAGASKNRTTAATRLNERSSRSHSLLILKILKTNKNPPFNKLCGKLAIIDLAGSEDNRRTGNKGVRLKESGAINSSLLTLSQVVDALNKGQTCVPYRSSKLTRLLQDCLGGNSHSFMIVNLAPEERYYFDTYTTLLFARKTKKIVNTVKTNEIKERPQLKRSFSQSKASTTTKSEADTSSEEVTSPVKKPRPEPQSFLSPLLRNQEKFQRDIKNEVFNRLTQLESKILNQISGAPTETAETSLSLPDSTTESAPAGHMTHAMDRLDELIHKMDSYKRTQSEACSGKEGADTPQSSPEEESSMGSSEEEEVFAEPKCTCPLAADGKTKKHMNGCGTGIKPRLATLSDSPLTPLFKKHTALKRRPKFQSCANKIKLEGEKENINKLQHSEAQVSHNTRILSILNTGSVKELQNLQTVGTKRAQLIHAYRQLNGEFDQFDDLTSVPGLTLKYLNSFLKSNLIQT